MLKKYNKQGQKAYQRADREDRSLVYRDWLRTIPTDGFFMDLDMIKFKTINDHPTPVAITELTRCDKERVGQSYLQAIIDRWYSRDRQADVIKRLAILLEVPAYLVCFHKDMQWLWVWSFRKEEWREFTGDEWAGFLNDL